MQAKDLELLYRIWLAELAHRERVAAVYDAALQSFPDRFHVTWRA